MFYEILLAEDFSRDWLFSVSDSCKVARDSCNVTQLTVQLVQILNALKKTCLFLTALISLQLRNCKLQLCP